MAEVDRYRIVMYGSSKGKPELRAKIELYTRSVETLSSAGKIRFHSGALPDDENKKGTLVMNLPYEELDNVVDLLRNEKPIYFAFHEDRAVLGHVVVLSFSTVKVASGRAEGDEPPANCVASMPLWGNCVASMPLWGNCVASMPLWGKWSRSARSSRQDA